MVDVCKLLLTASFGVYSQLHTDPPIQQLNPNTCSREGLYNQQIGICKTLSCLVGLLGPDFCDAVRRPQDLLAAILRVPFVDLVTTMTRPELPLTVHEYGEWGNPSDPAVLDQVRLCL